MTDKLSGLRYEIQKLLDGKSPCSAESLSVYGQVLNLLDEAIAKNADGLPEPSLISASEIDVVITDSKSGRSFRRSLPLDYFETDNGITISGEDSSGQPANIVLLSGTAIDKIRDLSGLGLDKPRCHD